MRNLIITGLLCYLSTGLFAADLKETNDFYYDQESSCIKTKEENNCLTEEEFFANSEVEVFNPWYNEDYDAGTKRLSPEFEINGVPGFQMEDRNLNEGFSFGWTDWSVRTQSYITYNKDSELGKLFHKSKGHATKNPDKDLYKKHLNNFSKYFNNIEECKESNTCNSSLLASISSVYDSVQSFITGDPLAGYNTDTYDFKTYTVNQETGIVTEALTNGKFFKMSGKNELKVADLVCENGEKGYVIQITNPKLTDENTGILEFNSCTNTKAEFK